MGHQYQPTGRIYGSANNFGVEATGGGDATYFDTIGDLLIGGSRGEIFATGNIMELFSNGYVVIDLDNDNNSANQFEIWNGVETPVYSKMKTATPWRQALSQPGQYGRLRTTPGIRD
ncbi:MAG: hypothetical protein IPH82_02730 [Chloroflexi bacterium]|nr:hypothetical protein [Chloroflexota bacterium]